MKRKRIILSAIIFTFILFIATLFGCSISYTIIYSDDAGNHKLTVEHGKIYELTDPLPSREGYVFAGLFDAEVGGTKYVDADGISVSTFKGNKDIKLYPQFIPKSYTITLDYGEADVVGVQTFSMDYDGTFPAMPEGLMVTGKDYMIFEGWYTQKDCGGEKIADKYGNSTKKLGKSIADLADSNGGITLYAGFSLTEYTVSFYEDDGMTLLKQVDVKHGTPISEVMPKVTTAGKKIYSWTAWLGTEYEEKTVTSSITLYVLEYAYNVEYDYGYDGKKEIVTVAAGKPYELVQPVRTGYSFIGWYNNDELKDSTVSLNDDLKLTAKWKVNTYVITYSINNAEGTLEDTEIKVTYGSGYNLAVPESNRTEYDFKGWYTKGGTALTDSDGKSLSAWSIAEDTTVYARWRLIICTVAFNGNGGTNGGSATVNRGATYTIPISTRIGYTFDGWYDDATGEKYTDSITVMRDISMTAKWKAKVYNVYLDTNGGDLSSSIINVEYDSVYTLPIPAREGYTFIGWYTSKDSSGQKMTIKNGECLSKWKGLSDTTFYAIWLTDYTIAFDRQSCATNNGFNPEEKGRDEDTTAHSRFEIIELICKGCVKNTDGTYFIPDGENIKLSIKVLQNIHALPTGNQFGSLSWTIHYMTGDSYKGQVYGTNINGKTIGYGAYYVKITYTDGTISQSNKVDFMNGAGKDSVVDLDINVSKTKTISKIEIVSVYEVYYDYWMTWSGAHQYYGNWRCCATLIFN